MTNPASYLPLIGAVTFLAAFSVASTSQANSPEELVVDLWTDFSQTCMPFLNNPETALSKPPRGQDGYQEHRSSDGAVVHRHEGFVGNYTRGSSVEVHLGTVAAMVACEVYRTETAQPIEPQQLETALRKLTSTLPELKMTGGEMTLFYAQGQGSSDGNYYNGEDTFGAFFLEGALPGRVDFIQVEIADGLFGLYVSATVAKEDWQ